MLDNDHIVTALLHSSITETQSDKCHSIEKFSSKSSTRNNTILKCEATITKPLHIFNGNFFSFCFYLPLHDANPLESIILLKKIPVLVHLFNCVYVRTSFFRHLCWSFKVFLSAVLCFPLKPIWYVELNRSFRLKSMKLSFKLRRFETLLLTADCGFKVDDVGSEQQFDS